MAEDKDPITRWCWTTCMSCYRCSDKGRYGHCETCSGRPDRELRRYPDPDDACDCRNGILRYKTQKGKLIVAKIPGDPYAGKVVGPKDTQDEHDYNAQVQQMRERTGQESWSPLQFDHTNESPDDWYESHKKGLR